MNFETVEIGNVYFKNWLSEEFRNSAHQLPENIRRGRNRSILIGFAEVVCSFASLILYDELRSRLALFFILMTIAATCAGLYFKLKLNYAGMLAHACYSISIIGGFYIYILIASYF